ncbi:MAG: hypothetical protein IJF92_01300 [Bacilli bacterium]|nr:hypothetical protein [Bacilli bacterium]
MKKIGYQGIKYSNSYYATLEFINKEKLGEIELIDLTTSKNVIDNLISKNIDYAVLAIKNSIVGEVKETKKVLNNSFKIISKIKIPIHHCLFRKKYVKNENIKYIASHEQAILQTKNNINKMFNNIEYIYTKDTALSAKLLNENKLDKNSAVICPYQAGVKYNLHCIKKNIEDKSDNYTEFVLLSYNK